MRWFFFETTQKMDLSKNRKRIRDGEEKTKIMCLLVQNTMKIVRYQRHRIEQATAAASQQWNT
jgi:hypothetical protein